jgi:simple sugar transport system substrate-binding protein
VILLKYFLCLFLSLSLNSFAQDKLIGFSKKGADTGEVLKVSFLYVGPIGDGGWTYSHELARRKVQDYFGKRIQTSYIENVPESSVAEQVYQDVVGNGNKIIFGTTFGYMEPMLKVARRNPEVKFEHATGYKTSENIRTYDNRGYEGAYLAGVLAGGMTRSNTIGFVASIPIPEIIRNINSFTLGARSVNPNVRTKILWVNEWFNPKKEEEAANALINAGADILIQNTDSSAVLQTAQRKGVYAIGWDSDMSNYARTAHLGSVTINWAPYYIKTINDYFKQSWTGGTSVWWGVKEGVIDLVSISNIVPVSLRQLIEKKKNSIKDSNFNIWTGPIYDNNGKLVLNKNSIADDKFLGGMNFFIDGVDGTVPR